VTHETISDEDATRRSTRKRLKNMKNNENWDNENLMCAMNVVGTRLKIQNTF
jgi:hypothetical protein